MPGWFDMTRTTLGRARQGNADLDEKMRAGVQETVAAPITSGQQYIDNAQRYNLLSPEGSPTYREARNLQDPRPPMPSPAATAPKPDGYISDVVNSPMPPPPMPAPTMPGSRQNHLAPPPSMPGPAPAASARANTDPAERQRRNRRIGMF
jgi:hypothetical protein